MIELDLSNLWEIKPPHGLTQNEWRTLAKDLPTHLKNITTHHSSFCDILDDRETPAKIKDFVDHLPAHFVDIVLLGIGGSALGALCLEKTLYPRGARHLHVLDNVDPILIAHVESLIDLKHTLFLVVSKSGDTTETLAQTFYFEAKIKTAGLPLEEHFVFITHPEKGFLRTLAQRNPRLKTFTIPPEIGGRFSVLTAVGLLPAALLNLSMEELLEGARRMRDSFLSTDFEKNLPYQLAVVQFLFAKKGKIQHVMMPYSQRLMALSDWYRQLLAESLGKAMDRQGNHRPVGITPLSALGVTDQHSQLQLYAEGPNDKLILFLEVEENGPSLEIPHAYPEESSLAYLKGITFQQLLQTEKRGTAEALTQMDRPNLTIHLPRIDEATLGALFLLLEGSVAFLGELWDVNAFDQPGVELSKKLTKEYLSRHSQ